MRWLLRGKSTQKKDVLKEPMVELPGGIVLTGYDLVCSILIMGRTGSGKTIYSGKYIAEQIAGRVGLLILSAKGSDRVLWEEIHRKAKKPLHVFSVNGDLRFNFLEYISKTEREARNISKAIQTIGEVLDGSAVRGGENGEYFRQQEERYLQHAVLVVLLATGKVDAVDLLRFIQGAPNSLAQVTDTKWLDGFHVQTFKAAYANVKRSCDKHDLEMATEFFCREMAELNSKTRSSITVGVTKTLFVFTTGICRELIGGSTNISPEALLNGESILVDAAPAEHGDVGKVIEAGFKLLSQRMILRRNINGDDPIVTIWIDEFPLTAFSHDATFLSTCRSNRGCMVLLQQGVSNLYAALKGEAGKNESEVILGQCKTRILHQLDSITANWASAQLGKRLEMFVSSSLAPSQGFFDDVFGQGQITTSFSSHYSEVIQPSVFQTLRTTANWSEAIVINDSWHKVSFVRK